jgi:histidine decarboxylase
MTGEPLYRPEMLAPADRERLASVLARIESSADRFLGYPCTGNFDYTPLLPFLRYPVNNVGDPFVQTTFGLNTHDIEVEVLGMFRDFVRAPADGFWGYVTSGGTEGNMYGIYLARELHPDGIVYYSEDTHYSVAKILRLLHARSIMIRSLPGGEIDCEDLRETIRVRRDVPPIVFANVGTTMKGAVDDLAAIRTVLDDLAIPASYIHVDAALSGMILPFVDDPQPFGFDAGVDSIAISGHKMIGAPIPSGVVLAKRAAVERIARSVEYIGTLDTTLSGSRNAIAPLMLWYALRTQGADGFRAIVARCIGRADYAIARLRAIGIEAWRHRNSITVVFPRPGAGIVAHWQLAVHGDIAHVITMPHVEERHIDALVADLARERAGATPR